MAIRDPRTKSPLFITCKDGKNPKLFIWRLYLEINFFPTSQTRVLFSSSSTDKCTGVFLHHRQECSSLLLLTCLTSLLPLPWFSVLCLLGSFSLACLSVWGQGHYFIWCICMCAVCAHVGGALASVYTCRGPRSLSGGFPFLSTIHCFETVFH